MNPESEHRPETAPGVHPKPGWSLRPASDRESGDAVVSNFALHGFPAKVSKASMAWTYSFWLGTAATALLLLLVLSGLPLLVLYVPSVERAYGSVKDIEHVVTFGRWIRAVHRISAHLMVAAAFLHMVRVYLTGAYKNGVGQGQRREWNWVLGVGLLMATLFLSFTGYLLPWDQLAYWAVTVGTNIASAVPLVGPNLRELLIGGRAIEQATLTRFYVLHVVFLPGALGILFAYHMWRVRKDGGLARSDREGILPAPRPVPPGPTKTYSLLGLARGTAPTVKARSAEEPGLTALAVPDLTRRIILVGLGTFTLVAFLALLIPSPLEEPANALVTPNPAKAPWYFLWLQEVVTDTTLRLGPLVINGALVGGVLLPGLLLGVLTAWPWLDKTPAEQAGTWFSPARRRQDQVFLGLVLAVLLLTIVGTFLRGPYWRIYWPWQSPPELPTRI